MCQEMLEEDATNNVVDHSNKENDIHDDFENPDDSENDADEEEVTLDQGRPSTIPKGKNGFKWSKKKQHETQVITREKEREKKRERKRRKEESGRVRTSIRMDNKKRESSELMNHSGRERDLRLSR